MAYQAPSLDATANTTVSVVLWCILICWSGSKAPWLLPVSTIFRTLFYGINSSLTTSVFQKTMNIRPFLLLFGSPKASVVALLDMSWTACSSFQTFGRPSWPDRHDLFGFKQQEANCIFRQELWCMPCYFGGQSNAGQHKN